MSTAFLGSLEMGDETYNVARRNEKTAMNLAPDNGRYTSDAKYSDCHTA